MWTTRSNRAVLSRFARTRSLAPSSNPGVVIGERLAARTGQRHRCAALDRGEAETERALERVIGKADRRAVDVRFEDPELPVGEHPVVQLAAPAIEVRVTDQQRDLG